MKRIIALILAAAVLGSFACFGAAASSQEDLQAQGEALLKETFATLQSDSYTLKMQTSGWDNSGNRIKRPRTIVMDGERSVEEFDWASSNLPAKWLLRIFLGNRIRILTTPEKSLVVFPGRRIYCASNLPADTNAFWLPDELPKQLTVQEINYQGKSHLSVSFDDPETTHTSVFLYRDGQLRAFLNSDDIEIEIDSLSPKAEADYFSTKWMLKQLFHVRYTEK